MTHEPGDAGRGADEGAKATADAALAPDQPTPQDARLSRLVLPFLTTIERAQVPLITQIKPSQTERILELRVEEGGLCFGLRIDAGIYLDEQFRRASPELAQRLAAMLREQRERGWDWELMPWSGLARTAADHEALGRLMARSVLALLSAAAAGPVRLRHVPTVPSVPGTPRFMALDLACLIGQEIDPASDDPTVSLFRELAPEADDAWLFLSVPGTHHVLLPVELRQQADQSCGRARVVRTELQDHLRTVAWRAAIVHEPVPVLSCVRGDGVYTVYAARGCHAFVLRVPADRFASVQARLERTLVRGSSGDTDGLT